MPICATYILASYRHGTLYTGYTTNLERRIHQHKTGFYKDAFSLRHRTFFLVYYEEKSDAHEAYVREQKLKGSNRRRKLRLIEKMNPSWRDLSGTLI